MDTLHKNIRNKTSWKTKSFQRAAGIFFYACCIYQHKTYRERTAKKKRIRSTWVKDWLKNRHAKGAYNNILNKLRLTDCESF